MLVHGIPIFDQMVNQAGMGWSASPYDQYIHSISQEHGLLENCGEWMDGIRPGNKLGFLPVHSCLTANLMREYVSMEGRIISTPNS